MSTPVVAFSVRPAGSAGLTLNALVPVTVGATRAAEGLIADPTSVVIVWVAGVIVGTAAIVTRIVAWANWEPSEEVTTYVVADFASLGVPDKTPVVELKDIPVGSAGAIEKYFVPRPVSV